MQNAFRKVSVFVWLCVLAVIIPLQNVQAKTAEAASSRPADNQLCIKKACAPLAREIGGTPVELRGLEKFSYWGFDLYTAAFYAPSGADALSDAPKSLVLDYLRKIRNDQIIKAGDHNLRKNPGNDLAALGPRLEALNSAYQSVEKGDRYELLYEPGKGTSLLFNGTPLVTVPGADFQKAYFGIWLSEYPINAKLRDKLAQK